MKSEHDPLSRLMDKDAIWECALRYTRGLDRLDESLVRSAYWEDAVTCHGPVNGSFDDFWAWWFPLQHDREACQHFALNHTVDFESPDTANAETYFVAAIKEHAADSVELLSGRYVDRFEKRGGEWRIAIRVLVFDWQATGDASEMSRRLAHNHRGRRDTRDISYERPLRPRRETPTAPGLDHPAGAPADRQR